MRKICVFLLCLTFVVSLCGCGRSGDKYAVYFASADGKSLAAEYYNLEEENLKKTVELILERLLQGPAKPEHRRVIPENTALIGVKIDGKIVTVNLSQDFEKTNDKATRLMAIYSLANTLCGIDGISRVKILVNGRGINYLSGGEEMDAISMNNVITADEIGKNQTAVLELYFADESKSGLISEKRMVDIKDNETVEKTAIAELLAGPVVKGHKLLPSDMKVLSVEVKDTFCYVNFSREFLSVPAQDAKLCVYSVVNTLTRLPKISSVQIFVEGEKAEKLGNIVLSEPFTYNTNLVN